MIDLCCKLPAMQDMRTLKVGDVVAVFVNTDGYPSIDEIDGISDDRKRIVLKRSSLVLEDDPEMHEDEDDDPLYPWYYGPDHERIRKLTPKGIEVFGDCVKIKELSDEMDDDGYDFDSDSWMWDEFFSKCSLQQAKKLHKLLTEIRSQKSIDYEKVLTKRDLYCRMPSPKKKIVIATPSSNDDELHVEEG